MTLLTIARSSRLRRPVISNALILSLGVMVSGCFSPAPIPDYILQLPSYYLGKRQFEMRYYETTDESKIVSASVGVLQDIGFTLGDTEAQLGLVTGYKDRQAADKGQFMMATLLTALSASSSYSYDPGYYDSIDDRQRIHASVITMPDAAAGKVYVRATFSRIVWNRGGRISRLETIDDPLLYSGFFERLSKSVFLQEHQI